MELQLSQQFHPVVVPVLPDKVSARPNGAKFGRQDHRIGRNSGALFGAGRGFMESVRVCVGRPGSQRDLRVRLPQDRHPRTEDQDTDFRWMNRKSRTVLLTEFRAIPVLLAQCASMRWYGVVVLWGYLGNTASSNVNGRYLPSQTYNRLKRTSNMHTDVQWVY